MNQKYKEKALFLINKRYDTDIRYIFKGLLILHTRLNQEVQQIDQNPPLIVERIIHLSIHYSQLATICRSFKGARRLQH